MVGPGNKDTRTFKETSFATASETLILSRMVLRPPSSTLMEVTHCSGTITSHSTLTSTDAPVPAEVQAEEYSALARFDVANGIYTTIAAGVNVYV